MVLLQLYTSVAEKNLAQKHWYIVLRRQVLGVFFLFHLKD